MFRENHWAGYAIPTIRECKLNSMGLWKSSVKNVSLFLVTNPASLKRMNFQLTNLVLGVQGNKRALFIGPEIMLGASYE